MKNKILVTFSLLILPTVSYAQGDIQTMVSTFGSFLYTGVIPFLLGLAFVFFIVNIIRYFIIESSDLEGRKKAKALAIYGVGAFLLISIFWGLIGFLFEGIGLGIDNTADEFDYINVMGG